MSRRVLIDHGRNYRPEGVDLVEVFSAYQSESDFCELDPAASADDRVRNKIARTNFLLSHRLAVPQEKEDTENLKRALDLAHKPAFKRRRSNFYEWQHNILSRGHVPEDAAAAMVKLAREFNDLVEQSGRDYRWETVVLACAVAAGGLGACPCNGGQVKVGAPASERPGAVGAWSAGG